jgi:hypothetical protein
MKSIILVIALFAAVFAFPLIKDSDLEVCIKQRCPDQYKKCENTKGCEDKLHKCEDKCGAKVAVSCWTLCIGTPGAAANVATCAVNQGCLDNQIFDFVS